MERRQFLNLSLSLGAGALLAKTLKIDPAVGEPAKITEKDIATDKTPGLPLVNFCKASDTKKNPKCGADRKAGQFCHSCRFYNTDNSKTKFKGAEYATCLIIQSMPTKYVPHDWYCSTWSEAEKKG